MAMRFMLDRQGVALVGDEHGYGPTVVLLHSGAERRQVWDPVVACLVGAGFRCVTLDQRGHGESGGSRDGDFATFVADIEHLRAWVQEPAVYVGSSLGGLSALAVAAAAMHHDPASIAGLVLVDAIPDPDPVRVRAGLTATLGSRVARSRLVLDILSRPEELRDAARQLTVPTLLVCGARSLALLHDDTARFQTLVPHAQQVTVQESGHLVAREQPQALAAALLAFVAQPAVRARMSNPGRSRAYARAEAWLHAHRAVAVPHLAGTLLEHLRRTALWLDRWNAPEHLRLAGLCHAAYGTDGFATALTDERASLIEALGAHAEQVVHTYGACDREHLYAQLGQASLVLRDRNTAETRTLDANEISDFTLLTLANELDVALSAPAGSSLRTAIENLLERLTPHRPVEAAAALRALGRSHPKGDP